MRSVYEGTLSTTTLGPKPQVESRLLNYSRAARQPPVRVAPHELIALLIAPDLGTMVSDGRLLRSYRRC
jgi:hypothetical protein